MAQVTFKGKPTLLEGTLPVVGEMAKDFDLVSADLTDVRLQDLKGKRTVLTTVVSLDTPVCIGSAKELNDKAKVGGFEVYFVSADLPFAQKRSCSHFERVKTLSMMRSKDFGKDYGLLIAEGPLKGILARSCMVIDEKGVITYFELVSEITSDIDYRSLYKALGV